LLVINIAFFAWARWVDVPAAAPVAVRDSSVPPLQLATPSAASKAATPSASAPAPNPVAVSASPAPAVPVAATAEPATGARCRTLGPFDDANAANVVSDRLRSRGFNPRERSAETSNPNVYWVYIGELTVEAQRRAIQTLNAAGIHDAAPMTAPEQSDRVSVGVFADQAHAVRRAEQVRALGLKPTLGLRQRTINAHWIDFDIKPSDAEPPASELVGVTPRGAIGLGPVKMADCPAGSAG
jgi:cell division septation protein DedD